MEELKENIRSEISAVPIQQLRHALETCKACSKAEGSPLKDSSVKLSKLKYSKKSRL
jgi:hypothetical protein